MMLTGMRTISDFFSIYNLSKDRDLETSEIHKANDFYGLATAIKKYAGFPNDYPLKFAIEHGFSEPFRKGWDCDLESNLPGIASWSDMRLSLNLKNTEKLPFAIGPSIFYASPALDEVSFLHEKQRLGKNLLAFPMHSTHHLKAKFDFDTFLLGLKKIRDQFDTVRICLYWIDIKEPYVAKLQSEGYEIVTAGHIYDPWFLPRIKSLFQLSDMVCSNSIGTHTYYSLFLQKPFYYKKCDFSVVGSTKFGEKFQQNRVDEMKAVFTFRDKLLEKCPGLSSFSDSISYDEHKMASNIAGFKCIRSQQEMRSLIELMEELYQSSPDKGQGFQTAVKLLKKNNDEGLNCKFLKKEISRARDSNRKMIIKSWSNEC